MCALICLEVLQEDDMQSTEGSEQRHRSAWSVYQYLVVEVWHQYSKEHGLTKGMTTLHNGPPALSLHSSNSRKTNGSRRFPERQRRCTLYLQLLLGSIHTLTLSMFELESCVPSTATAALTGLHAQQRDYTPWICPSQTGFAS